MGIKLTNHYNQIIQIKSQYTKRILKFRKQSISLLNSCFKKFPENDVENFNLNSIIDPILDNYKLGSIGQYDDEDDKHAAKVQKLPVILEFINTLATFKHLSNQFLTLKMLNFVTNL